jgi:hypothetical protein
VEREVVLMIAATVRPATLPARVAPTLGATLREIHRQWIDEARQRLDRYGTGGGFLGRWSVRPAVSAREGHGSGPGPAVAAP